MRVAWVVNTRHRVLLVKALPVRENWLRRGGALLRRQCRMQVLGALGLAACAAEPSEPGFDQLSQYLVLGEGISQQQAETVQKSDSERELTRSVPALTVAWGQKLGQPWAKLNKGQALEAVVRNTTKKAMTFRLVVICIDASGEFHHQVLGEPTLAAKSELRWPISTESLPYRTAGGATTVMVSASWKRMGRGPLRSDSPRRMVTFDERFEQADVRSVRDQLRYNAQQIGSGHSVRPRKVRRGKRPAKVVGPPGARASKRFGYALVIPDGAPGLSSPPVPKAAK